MASRGSSRRVRRVAREEFVADMMMMTHPSPPPPATELAPFNKMIRLKRLARGVREVHGERRAQLQSGGTRSYHIEGRADIVPVLRVEMQAEGWCVKRMVPPG